MNRLFIIGAGASIDHSNGLLPGTKEFLVKAREAAQKRSAIDFFHDFDDAYDLEPFVREPISEESQATQTYLSWFYGIWPQNLGKKMWGPDEDHFFQKKYIDKQLLNRLNDVDIEELLTLARISREIDPRDPHEENIITLIVQTLNYYSGFIDPKDGAYKEFFDQLKPESDSIISFNWDTLFDSLISEYYSEHLRTEVDRIIYFKNYLEVCTAEREGYIDGLGNKKPYLLKRLKGKGVDTDEFGSYYLKLHGSINLVICKNHLCRNFQKPFLRKGSLLEENLCRECHESLSLHLIPPIQNKPIRETPYIRRSWNKARELVRSAKQIVFWGYSLPPTDHWSNWLVRQGWAGTCEEIVIINPACHFNGKRDDRFVSRFCPKNKFWDKEFKLKTYSSFAEFLGNSD